MKKLCTRALILAVSCYSVLKWGSDNQYTISLVGESLCESTVKLFARKLLKSKLSQFLFKFCDNLFPVFSMFFNVQNCVVMDEVRLLRGYENQFVKIQTSIHRRNLSFVFCLSFFATLSQLALPNTAEVILNLPWSL